MTGRTLDRALAPIVPPAPAAYFSNTPQGIDQMPVPPDLVTRRNSPGLDEIANRSATYAMALEQMLAAMRKQQNLQLKSDDSKNWAIALIQSWASVVDVLTFYQERLANEGFLRTAHDPRSIRELLRAMGIEPQPGLAATTYLAFTVRTTADKLAGRDPNANIRQNVLIPKGTQVQSVPTFGRAAIGQKAVRELPTPEQLPQVFETTAPFEARAEWNQLHPGSSIGMRWPDLRPDCFLLRAEGVKTDLHTGDALLIVGAEAQPGQSAPARLAFVQDVERRSQQGYTLITLQPDPLHAASGPTLRAPTVFALRKKAQLRTYDQAGIHYTAASQANWMPCTLGLPNTAVHDLIRTGSSALLAATDKGIFRSTDDGDAWLASCTGLLQAKIRALASCQDEKLYAGSDEGRLFVSLDDGLSWKLVAPPITRRSTLNLAALLPFLRKETTPLPKAAINKLVTLDDQGVEKLVAATDQGSFISSDGGMTWSLSPSGDAGANAPAAAWAVATGAKRWKAVVGTDKGVFPVAEKPWKPGLKQVILAGMVIGLALAGLGAGGTSLARSTVIEKIPMLAPLLSALVLAYVHFFASFAFWVVLLVAGVAALVALLRVRQSRLAREREDLLDPLGVPVHALIAQADNTLIAGTEQGAQRWDDATKQWNPLSDGLFRDIFSVNASESADLDAGTLSDDVRQAFLDKEMDLGDEATVEVVKPGERWTIREPKAAIFFALWREGDAITVNRPGESDLRALALNRGVLYAGSTDGRVFQADGNQWELFDQNLHLAEVLGFCSAADGLLATGVIPDAKPDRHWTRFHLQRRLLDLDKTYKLETGSWVVLREQDTMVRYRAASVATVAGRTGKRIGSFSRVGVDRAEQLAAFDRTVTEAWVQSEPLAPFDNSPLYGTQLNLDGFVPGLQAGQTLMISGKRMRLELGQVPAGLKLVSADGLQARPLLSGAVLQVMAAPQTDEATGQRLQLRDRDGFVGQVLLSADQFTWTPAQDDDQSVAEAATIATVAQQATTALSLAGPLQFVYDHSTVVIYANIVPATHGQAVEAEILGSGDGSAANQTFKLQHQPLTFIETDKGTIAPDSLHVKVNDVEWPRADTLSDLAPNERGYSVRQDVKGNATIIFGDGTHGARLPHGANNITVSYRYGSGQAGNVPANSLTVLRTRPPGVNGVTNPLPARGGVDAETRPEPKTLLGLSAAQRCVSLKDYQDQSRAFPGIAKARVELIPYNGAGLVHITAAGADKPLDPASVPADTLWQYIQTHQANSLHPVQVDPFELIYFNIAATIVLDPAVAGPTDEVESNIRAALAGAFGFDVRDLAKPVAASEVIAVLQSVPAIRAVELNLLYINGTPEMLNTELASQPARLENGKVLPAQLLLVNSTGDDGIVLEIQ